MPSASFLAAMALLQNAKPLIKVEFIDAAGASTDISSYYLGGANIESVKDRSPDQQLQAGTINLVLDNHDNKFSEFVTTSLIYNVKYHKAKIKVSAGFRFSDGSTEYDSMFLGLIDTLTPDPIMSQVTITCRDLIGLILDGTIHPRPAGEVPTAGASNKGNGTISRIETKPFVTVTENWTITCTLGGGDATATFSVVGSVSGNIGTATSGTQFSNGTTGGVKFTIKAGGTAWSSGDSFIFSVSGYPQWTTLNPVKIIWSVLTGYDYDTNTQNTFSALVLGLDRTQSTANTDINWTTFQNAVADIDRQSALKVKGYAAYDESLLTFVQSLLSLFLGCLFTDGSGKINIQTFIPRYNSTSPRLFADTLQISEIAPIRDKQEIYNTVSVDFKYTDSWEFSDVSVVYDGKYISTDTTSLADYKTVFAYTSQIRWYKAGSTHIADLAQKLLGRYAQPPVNLEFKTGLDGIETKLGDIVSVTDAKYNIAGASCEVVRVLKNLDGDPKNVQIRARRDGDINIAWGFLGSSANEGDGISPQAATYDTASASDKTFCYESQSGQPATSSPYYLMF